MPHAKAVVLVGVLTTFLLLASTAAAVAVEPTGEYPQSTFERQQLTDRSEIAVNVSNGNLLVSNTDLHIAGTGLDLTIGRYYNGMSQLTGSLGSRWNMGTGQDVRLYNGGATAKLKGPTGDVLTFTQSTTEYGVYDPPPGVHATLWRVFQTGACEYDDICERFWILTDHATETQQSFTYTGTGSWERLTEQVDRYGNIISFTYEGDALTSIRDTQGRVVSVSRSSGRIEQLTDSTGRTIRYAYDQGRLKTYTDAAGKPTVYDYDTAGRLNSIKTPAGRVTKVTYDSQGRVATVVRTTDAAHTTGPTTVFEYGSGSPCAAGEAKGVVSDPEAATSPGHKVTYCSDSSGRVTRSVDADGNLTTTTYAATGDVASITAPGGGVTNFAYDPQTRNLLCVQRGATQVQNCNSASGGLKTTIAYEDNGLWSKYLPTRVTDTQGYSETLCYNWTYRSGCSTTYTGPSGSLMSRTNSLPTQNTWRYAYNAKGNPIAVTDPRGSTTTYGYEASGHNLRSITPPAGAGLGVWTITPDALSRPRVVTDAKGQTRTTTYDNLDRANQVESAPSGSTVTHGYDDDGAMTSVTDSGDASKAATYSVDDLLRVKREDFAGGTASIYTYDGASNLKTLTDGGGTTTYTYNGLNQMTSMLEPGDPVATTFSYNSDGARTQIKYPSGVTVDTAYDVPSGRVRSVTNKRGSGSVLKSYTYRYTIEDNSAEPDDPARWIDTERPVLVTDHAGNHTYNSYDALGRLWDATTYGPNPQRHRFVLDGMGNRMSQTINRSGSSGGSTTNWAYDPAGLPCWKEEFSAAPQTSSACSSMPSGAKAYFHDANGNDTSNTHHSWTYNSANQPSSVNVFALYSGYATALSFRGVGQSELIKDGSMSLQSNQLGIGARGSRFYPRADDGTVISQRKIASGTRGFSTSDLRNYLYDGEGSVVGLTDANGNLSASYNYEPYGHPANYSSVGDPNPFGYRGLYNAGVGTAGAMCGAPLLGGGSPYDAEDGRYTMMSFSLPSPGKMLDTAWKYRKQIATVAAAGVCIAASAGACITAAGIYLGAASADNARRLATEPGFGLSDALRAQVGDTVSAGLMGAVPASALVQGASRGALTAEALLPKSTIGRVAVNSSLTAPGTVAGLIWK